MILGKRADLSSLLDKETKCTVEAEFEVARYGLNDFFKENDLDFENNTIIRREILPSGKSRAFINDTPITLDVLSELGNRLIDVHSQHQTLQLTSNEFQFQVIDALADNKSFLKDYTDTLGQHKICSNALKSLIDLQETANKELDYNSFLLKELQAAPLKIGMLEELEAQFEQLNNVETISEQLAKGHGLLNDEQVGILNLLTELKQVGNKLAAFGNKFNELNTRIQSVFIEMDDISQDLHALYGNIEADPQLMEEIGNKLQLIYGLQKKHGVQNVAELIAVRDGLAQKVAITESLEAKINKKQEELAALQKTLEGTSKIMTERRKQAIPKLKQQLEGSLANLGMPNARFLIELAPSKTFLPNGNDDLKFLFSANKGSDFGELKKVASGGELSRIMLAIKAILAQYEHLPTLMFDEIDTGVSGEISNKMAEIMLAMSKTMQVFSITHLPQVASKGDHHFKVFKTDEGDTTRTRMKALPLEARIMELAEMLGGKNISESAIAHAKQLLN